MTDENLLIELKELACKLEITIREEALDLEESWSSGGLCRVDGHPFLILNSRATLREKIQVMVKALKPFDLSNLYLKPVLRNLLEGDEP